MRLSVVIAVAASGAFLAPAVACAGEAAPKSFVDIALGWAIPEAHADEVKQSTKHGFFVGVQSGLIDSGVGPAVAGISLSSPEPGAVMANGYYAYVTDWDLGTYVGGGFGQLNLGVNEYARTGLSRDYAYQGMAGLTYSFTPAIALGLEYRYAGTMDPLLSTQTLPNAIDAQSLTLRFDFVLN
ncbi:MAG: outer membrane beta-barrel protein [Alphaproteobacteria bacterium]|nr:outer membrane beta-barrel protein [Alphaproteobacteria bacterium]